MTLITSDSLIYEHFDTVQNKVNRFLLSTLRLGQRLAKTGALFLFYSRFYPSRDNLIWEAKLNKLYIYTVIQSLSFHHQSACAHIPVILHHDALNTRKFVLNFVQAHFRFLQHTY